MPEKNGISEYIKYQFSSSDKNFWLKGVHIFNNHVFIQTYPESAFISISFVQLFIPELVKIVCFIYWTAFQILDLIMVNPFGILAAFVIDKVKNHININMIPFLRIQFDFFIFLILMI